MAPIREFLSAIDARWKPIGPEPLALQIIGSAALMLQTDYDRGTKDGDVLESRHDAAAIKDQLLVLAGRNTDISKQFSIYIDVVRRGLLFLPQQPAFHPMPDFPLENFKVEVLDPVDVAVSKLIRYNNEDANDIRAMADRNLLDHARLVSRFEAAAERFSLDARAPDVPGYLKHLRTVERDILAVAPAEVNLPPECSANS